MLIVSDLSKSFGEGNNKTTLFSHLSLTVDAGQSVAIMGPSGCGKSTLLHIIAKLMPVDSGRVELVTSNQKIAIDRLDERGSNALRKDLIGIVFQRFNLIDFITVRDNIMLPAIHKGCANQDDIDALCQTLALQPLMNKFPPQLSGGEQQRVAIARALAHKPQLVLADEPTGNLDPRTSASVASLLFNLCRTNGTMLVIVTHSAEVAARADKSFILSNQSLVAQDA